MPTQLFTRLDLDLIYLPFAELAFELAARCATQGATYFAISGYRSCSEQAALYAQGRTKPGKVVTNARPGFSAHNYGLAIDFCRDAEAERAGLQPDWQLESYRILASQAAALGLESGMSWTTFREGPHIQLPLAKHGITLAKLDELQRHEGVHAVWEYLDKQSWQGCTQPR